METHIEYDGRNRVKRVFYTGTGGSPLPSGVIATGETNYTYSTTIPSRLMQVSDELGTESYCYDTLGRVTSVTRGMENVSYTTQYV